MVVHWRACDMLVHGVAFFSVVGTPLITGAVDVQWLHRRRHFPKIGILFPLVKLRI